MNAPSTYEKKVSAEKASVDFTDKVRFQVEISRERAGLLEDLRARCLVDSRKDLFDAAFTLLDWAVSEVEAGRDVGSINRERKEFDVLRMPELTNAARRSRGAQR
jgi:hypothetical protein